MARPGTWRRIVALVTALAIAAPAGAIAQALGHGDCHSCPPTCPMHRPGTSRCHEGGQPKEQDRSPGCKLSQRGCGQYGGDRAFELPPAVLRPSELALEVAPMVAPPPARTLVVSRNADPPRRRRRSPAADGRSPDSFLIASSRERTLVVRPWAYAGAADVGSPIQRKVLHMRSLLLATASAAVLALASPARAHIVVTPGEIAAGQSGTFEMRVPTELHVPVVRYTGDPGDESASQRKVTPPAP